MHLKRDTPALEYFNTPLTPTFSSRESVNLRKLAAPFCALPLSFNRFRWPLTCSLMLEDPVTVKCLSNNRSAVIGNSQDCDVGDAR